MTDEGFRLRPLHRQRGRRHQSVQVLGEQELAELLNVPVSAVKTRLQILGWRFHEDSLGHIWATAQALPPDRSPEVPDPE